MLPAELTGDPGPDRRGARGPLPDDRGPQGPRGLRLPRSPHRHRRVRPHEPARRLALDRQLLPRRGGHRAAHGEPGRGGAPRGDERGAVPVARGLGCRPGGRRSGRPAPRATSRRSTTAARSSRGTPPTSSSTSSPSSGTTSCTTGAPGARSSGSSSRSPSERPRLVARAFVSATGSAGTIGAGDYLKERLGSQIVAVEALECPTMLANGFGEHNIQGIGDKHIPLIHNVMNTDVATAVSDRATDRLNVLFQTRVGRRLPLTPTPGARTRGGGPRVARPVVALQHPGRDQDGEVLRVGTRRCGR